MTHTTSVRTWNSHTGDDGSLHCLGNGRLCVYQQGPNIVQIFGPPYSSPNVYSLTLASDFQIHSESQREFGTAIWTHRLKSGEKDIGTLRDFVDAEIPGLVRVMELAEPLRFQLKGEQPLDIVDYSQKENKPIALDGGVMLRLPAGRPIYHTYPFPNRIHHWLAWQGPVQARIDAKNGIADLECGPGRCVIYSVGGPDYPSTANNLEALSALSPDICLERTRRWWQSFSSQRSKVISSIPSGLPRREELLRVIDSVAVLIRAQQAAEGAVLAGHNYHLGYVRDQYGVARCLLALGHHEQARSVLDFYWNTWQQYGRIHNAQAPGVPGVFHVHENDEVEITGFLIVQAFDLLKATGDEKYLRKIFPMLEWAWESQKKHLIEGMLPFNGDETYVACGVLPRHTLNDGSAEATLLFLEGGRRLLDWVEAGRHWPAERIETERELLDSVRGCYRENFWLDGKLAANNPGRVAAGEMPRFRHGICEGCSQGIEWTERVSTGRYVCVRCLAGEPPPPEPPVAYFLQPVSLTPLYYDSQLFPLADLRPAVESILDRYDRTGSFSSLESGDGSNFTVGYDYGLLLYSLVAVENPKARLFYEKTLDVVDATDAWVEGYLSHQPTATRCRPWESGINLEALLLFAQKGWKSSSQDV